MKNKQKALEQAKYLRDSIVRVHNVLVNQSKQHAQVCIATGKPTSMCLSHFANLARICIDLENEINRIEEYGA